MLQVSVADKANGDLWTDKNATAAVWDAVNQGLFDLMHSQHTEKRLGGLLAMSASSKFLNIRSY